MADQQQKAMSTFDVTCGDSTRGRISAKSPDKTREMAGEMCQVHEGVQQGPTPRS